MKKLPMEQDGNKGLHRGLRGDKKSDVSIANITMLYVYGGSLMS